MLRQAARRSAGLALALMALQPLARAAEHITLRNGFELDCARRETTGDRVRLYLLPAGDQGTNSTGNYMEVAANAIVRADVIPDPSVQALPHASSLTASSSLTLPSSASLTASEMREMLTRAGATHNIDADLLASVVRAESNGNPRAISRAGARGLMQLMPGTASDLGVQNAFVPEQNIRGGTAYLDQLLTRYRDNIALALAAYNAGPLAVDRYHGIPPYAETRAYVARVIREFNRLKRAANPQIVAAK